LNEGEGGIKVKELFKSNKKKGKLKRKVEKKKGGGSNDL